MRKLKNTVYRYGKIGEFASVMENIYGSKIMSVSMEI
jgi:hypothetical protein